MNTSRNPFFGRIAALRGARSFAYPIDMSLSLCSVRLALSPRRGGAQHFGVGEANSGCSRKRLAPPVTCRSHNPEILNFWRYS